MWNYWYRSCKKRNLQRGLSYLNMKFWEPDFNKNIRCFIPTSKVTQPVSNTVPQLKNSSTVFSFHCAHNWYDLHVISNVQNISIHIWSYDIFPPFLFLRWNLSSDFLGACIYRHSLSHPNWLSIVIKNLWRTKLLQEMNITVL